MKKILKFVFTLFVAYLLGFLIFCLIPRQGPADVMVVLGSKVMEDGKPSPRLKARLDEAVRAYHDKLAPLILVSGGHPPGGYDEAEVMQDYLLMADVPVEAIITDNKGANTMATALNTERIMKEKHLRSALIITQYFHVARCLVAFHKAGIEKCTAAYPLYADLRDPYSIVREMGGVPLYILFNRADY